MALRFSQYENVESVTIVTRKRPSKEQLYQVLGKDYPTTIDFIELPAKQNWGGVLVNMARFHRDVRTMAERYDICVSSYNEQDFGKPSIQYVHHPLFASRALLRKYQIIGSTTVADRSPLLEQCLNRIVRFISGANVRSWQQNTTITNSHFMKGVLEEAGFTNIAVAYPGLIDDAFQHLGTIRKKKQLCAIGRISPDKHTLELLHLFKALHERHPEFNLILCGLAENEAYLNEVKQCIHEKALPVELKLNVDRAELLQILQESKYYINPKPFEHFGIATVEAMMCGVIPLLHSSGGSIELAIDSVQLFLKIEDLLTNLKRLEADRRLQEMIVQKGMLKKNEFSIEAFNLSIDNAFKEFLQLR